MYGLKVDPGSVFSNSILGNAFCVHQSGLPCQIKWSSNLGKSWMNEGLSEKYLCLNTKKLIIDSVVGY